MTLSYGFEKNKDGITLTELYGKAQGSVTVPAVWREQKVTAIGEALFRGKKQLEELIISKGIVSSGWWALGECANLKSVILPLSFREIGYRSFSGCTSLQQIVLPENIEQVGEAAFWGCTALKQIVLPPKLKRIRNRTFYGCAHLTDIEILPSVERIEWGAFEHCKGLRRLIIPDGVTEIGSNAFRECSGLKELRFPDSAAEISENLFGLRHLPPLERGYIPHVDLSLWEEDARKILALCYLTTAKQHDAGEQKMFEDYIRENDREMISLAISLSNLPALSGLYDMGLPAENAVDGYIEEANQLRRREAVVSLLEYKQSRFGGRSVAERFAEEFSFRDEFDF